MPTSRRRRTRLSFGQAAKRPNGRWRARYFGPDTLLHNAHTTFATKDSAVAWLAAEQRLIELGNWTPPASRRPGSDRPDLFGAYGQAWLDNRSNLKPRTRAHYQRLLDRMLFPAFATVPVPSITPESVRSWHTRLGTDQPTQRAHAYSLLRAILGQAVDDRLIDHNPAHVRGAGNVRRVHQPQPATAMELEALADAMPPRLRAAVYLAGWCGLRFGELTELRRADVDLTTGVVHVRRAVVRVNGEVVVGRPKSEAGVRTVAIPPHVVPVIREHLANNVNGRDGLLFPAADGHSHLAPATLYGRNPSKRYPQGTNFYGARAKIGRPDLRWHDLRHTGATLAAATGATLAQIMARLGHSTAGAALRYQHAVEDADQLIASKLSELAGGAK